uniref:60S ribosomal protein L2, mitochondrial n=1 Tax=California macrophylla TaxID=337344 RepID=A0A0G2YMU4_9ROSI|nr:ribosomal protein L2 [California macrophylla]
MQGGGRALLLQGKTLKNAALPHTQLGNAMMQPALFSQSELFSSVRRPKRGNPDVLKAKDGKTLKQFTWSKATTAGRNSSGCITSFHRGGGVKRLHRTVDLKRSTPAVGIVERIEYDPNRSGRLALVRWVEGVSPKKMNATEKFTPIDKIPEPISTTSCGQFSFYSMPGKVEQRSAAYLSPKQTEGYVVVGLPKGMPRPSESSIASEVSGTKITSVRDVFLAAFTPKPKVNAMSHSFVRSSGLPRTAGLPRIAVAGARPAFFAPQMKDEVKEDDTFSLSEIQQWRKDSVVWAHRLKRKTALSFRTRQTQ